MSVSPWFGAVLRLSDVTVTREVLETHLGRVVDRFEPSASGKLHFADVRVPVGDTLWPAVTDLVDQIGPKVLSFTQSGAVGAANFDLGFSFHDSQVMTSALIPSVVAEIIGRNGISITISIYLTGSTA